MAEEDVCLKIRGDFVSNLVNYMPLFDKSKEMDFELLCKMVRGRTD